VHVTWTVAALACGVLILGGVAGCGSQTEDANADGGGACPVELVFDGRTYVATPEDRALTTDASLPLASFTACYDGTPDEGRYVPTRRLSGVDDQIAFAAKLGGQWTLFVSDHVDKSCQVKYVRC
jgi:hypothetical protein